jgi:hypothetical protein
MARLIVLDSGPLGMIVRAPSKPHIVRCLTWLKTILSTGAVVVIPEIAHYEASETPFTVLEIPQPGATRVNAGSQG